MPREHLSARDKWQPEANARGTSAEEMFTAVMREHLGETELDLVEKPLEMKGIYGTRTPSGQKHGIIPEFMIRNPENKRAIFVEVKRQRAAGNAHERACKYMMPGILDAMRKIGKQPPDVLPMWWIFTNGIASDPNYRREINFWFRGIERNLTLWENIEDPQPIVDHYHRAIRSMLQNP